MVEMNEAKLRACVLWHLFVDSLARSLIEILPGLGRAWVPQAGPASRAEGSRLSQRRSERGWHHASLLGAMAVSLMPTQRHIRIRLTDRLGHAMSELTGEPDARPIYRLSARLPLTNPACTRAMLAVRSRLQAPYGLVRQLCNP